MPVRVGPPPRPSASSALDLPGQPHPPTQGPPWGPAWSPTSCGYSRKQPRQVPPTPRAEIWGSRAGDWGGGAITGPKPPFWLPLKDGPFDRSLKCTVTSLWGRERLAGALGAQGCGVSCNWLVLPPPPLAHNPDSSQTPTSVLFLFPFQDSLAADFCRVRAGVPEAVRVRVPGATAACLSQGPAFRLSSIL